MAFIVSDRAKLTDDVDHACDSLIDESDVPFDHVGTVMSIFQQVEVTHDDA